MFIFYSVYFIVHKSICFMCNFSLSIYNTALQNGLIENSQGEFSVGLGYFWGAFAGSIGSLFSSPFFMVRIRTFYELFILFNILES